MAQWESTLKEIFGEIKEVRQSINKIEVKIAEMPCDVHNERFKSLKNGQVRLWGVVLVLLAGLCGVAWKALT